MTSLDAKRMQPWRVAPFHHDLAHARICELGLYSSESRSSKLRLPPLWWQTAPEQVALL